MAQRVDPLSVQCFVSLGFRRHLLFLLLAFS